MYNDKFIIPLNCFPPFSPDCLNTLRTSAEDIYTSFLAVFVSAHNYDEVFTLIDEYWEESPWSDHYFEGQIYHREDAIQELLNTYLQFHTRVQRTLKFLRSPPIGFGIDILEVIRVNEFDCMVSIAFTDYGDYEEHGPMTDEIASPYNSLKEFNHAPQ